MAYENITLNNPQAAGESMSAYRARLAEAYRQASDALYRNAFTPEEIAAGVMDDSKSGYSFSGAFPGGSMPPNTPFTNEIIPPNTPGTSEGEMRYGVVSGQQVPFYWIGGQWVSNRATGNNTGNDPGRDFLYAPPTNFIGGGGMPTDTSGAFGPYTAYLQSRGLGGGYWNPAQRYQANLYDPMRFMWETQQPYKAALGQTTPGWTDYMGQVGGMGGVQSQASGILGGLFGMSPQARQEWGMGFEPQYDPFTGGTLKNDETGQRSMGELQNLLTYGLANKFGPMGASWAASRAPQMQQQWQLQQAGGGAGMPFMDYLRQTYGL